MLSWDDYDNNTEETAVVNEAALQQLKTAEQPAPAAPVAPIVEAAPAPVSPEPAPAAPVLETAAPQETDVPETEAALDEVFESSENRERVTVDQKP